MKMSDIKYDSAAVKKCLKRVGDRVVASEPISIIVPKRYVDKDFVKFDEGTMVLGIFLYLTNDGKYGYSNAPAMMSIDPDMTSSITINDEECFRFVFSKGSTVIKTVHLIKNDKLLYFIYRDFTSMGNVPAYMGYLTLGKIFDNAKHFTGINLVNTITVSHLLISFVARNPDNRQQYFRTIASPSNYNTAYYAGMRSVAYAASNDVSRLIGGHFDDKMTTAVITENKETQEMESIWRS